MNVIDSELVVVESTADWDTNAVVLKVNATVLIFTMNIIITVFVA